MCVSRLHRVLNRPDDGYVEVEDVLGRVERVALLAFDGPDPQPGEWLVVHSGYAIDRVDPGEAATVAAELREVLLTPGDGK